MNQAPDMKQPMTLEGMFETDITLYPKEGMTIAPLTEPQHAQIQKHVKRFGSGSVTMDVFTDKMAYKPGEGLQVRVKINNRSACAVTPKYILYRKQSRIFPGGRTIGVFPILKRNAKPVHAHSNETMTTVITIPRGIPPTISIESHIEIQYNLKMKKKGVPPTTSSFYHAFLKLNSCMVTCYQANSILLHSYWMIKTIAVCQTSQLRCLTEPARKHLTSALMKMLDPHEERHRTAAGPSTVSLQVWLDMTGSNFTYLTLPILVLPNSLHSAKQRTQQQQLPDAFTLGVAEYPKPNQQMPKAGQRSPKPRSMDYPPNY
ncbi:uncharacterized protein LOC133475321 isoform X2 [Phyllopteryx taeniolatus]|uniref:uncharacterized protein LOC133475321 isoform X2 n=1 Tax=Phyllopteryx taeniolatus TaxID=161469 RepID=UPI002AD2970A|nr:uncharacterized protein LOC133475321 isoform X2 [Phyllopteryx taeniolatus]